MTHFLNWLKVIWTLQMSWYLIKTIREYKYFKGDIRNIKNSHKGDFRGKKQYLFSFLKVMKTSWSLIGWTRYPDMWELQNTLRHSNNLKKTVPWLPSSLKLHLFFFWRPWAINYVSGLPINSLEFVFSIIEKIRYTNG